ncbi:MAG: permease-like cell division protein FtsX [Tannerella sp.]|nr:permease-like cell division protein FtsX [Tannerella sp.]
MGTFFITGLLSNELSVYMKENLSFSIVLKENLSKGEIQQMQKKLEALPFIKSTKYISQEEAAKEMEAELGEDPQVFLGYNPFHAAIEIKLKSDYTNADSMHVIEKKLTAYANVSELLYQKEMMQIVNNNVKRIGLALSIVIIILVLVSFMLISNTIRLLIYSKRFLIYTMRLVGATPNFIRRPFIRYNIVSGFLAGILAILILSGTLYYVQESSGLGNILQWNDIFVVFGVVMVVGILMSVVAAYFAVNRYLRMERGKMYYI